MLGVEKTVARGSPPNVITIELSTFQISSPTAPGCNPGFIRMAQAILKLDLTSDPRARHGHVHGTLGAFYPLAPKHRP